jgi:Tol biopolymer transport system component
MLTRFWIVITLVFSGVSSGSILLLIILMGLFPVPHELLYVRDGRLFRLDLSHDLAAPLPSRFAGIQAVAAAANREWIAFYGWDHETINLYRISALGDDLLQLADLGGPGAIPAWSPDSQWIAFASAHQETAGLYTVRPDGTALQRIAPERTVYLEWSPDGERLVFVANCENNCDVFVVDADGGDLRQLTRNGSVEALPVWSPDGEWIVFMSNRSVSYELYAFRADCDDTVLSGCAALRLTDNRDFDGYPAWAPDGSSLVYSSDHLGELQLYRLAADCLDAATICLPEPVTLGLLPALAPAWSADGAWLAYIRVEDGMNIEIMPAAGYPSRRVAERVARDQVIVWLGE